VKLDADGTNQARFIPCRRHRKIIYSIYLIIRNAD
jgi:hypothetical protein